MFELITFVLGYCVAVLFPVPGLSRFILDKWTELVEKIKTKILK